MDDKELLALLLNNPTKGVLALIKQYGGYAKAIIMRVGVSNKEDIEECISDVFAKLWQARNTIDLEKGSLKGYIAIISRNQAVNKVKRQQRVGDLLPIEELELGVDIDMEQEVANKQNALLLNEVIEMLEEPDREIFIRRYFFYEQVKTIAERLGLAPKAVENKLYTGKRHLKETLLERGIIL